MDNTRETKLPHCCYSSGAVSQYDLRFAFLWMKFKYRIPHTAALVESCNYDLPKHRFLRFRNITFILKREQDICKDCHNTGCRDGITENEL